ncbi:hypothetical protein [Deinococcus yunweiensis]|uniref:hypothetical protein n=1 Tax=Deinococcus yunweiensis TaxID=367282 RepID=UPI00398E9CDF
MLTIAEHTAQRRNATRDRSVPAAAVAAQYASAEFPNLTEAHRTRWIDEGATS